MNKFIILVAVMVMGSHGAPINSDSTTQNMNTNSYPTTDITGLLTAARLYAIHTEQSVNDLEREMVST